MRKEIIISGVIILLVTIGNIVTENYTKKSIEYINADLMAFKEKILKEENEKLDSEVNNLKEHWDSMQEKLAFYIEHDELEKVETQILMIEGNMEAGLYKEIVPEIEKCSFILEHIGDKTTLNIKNIF